MQLGRTRDIALLIAVATYSAGYATPALAVLLVLSLAEVLTGSWRWVRTSIDLPLLALALAAVASGLASEWRAVSLALAALLFVTAVVSVRSVAVYAQGGPARVGRLLLIWIAGGVVAALWGLVRAAAGLAEGRTAIQHFGTPSFGDLLRVLSATTPGVGENALGTTVAVALVLAAGLAVSGGLPRRWAYAAIPLLLTGLILTWVRAAWLGAAAGILVAFITGTPRPARLRLLPGAAALTIVGVAVISLWPALGAEVQSIVNLQANRNRLMIWRAMPRMVADHPLLGTGYGTFVEAYPRYRLPEATELTPPFAHNLLLNFAVETGVIGLAALVALCAVSLRSAWHWAQRSPPAGASRGAATAVLAALAALLVNQLFDGSIMSIHLGFGFFALLVLGPLGARAAAARPEETAAR